MSSQRAVLSAFKLQKSLSHPYALMRGSRIGVVNRYGFVSNYLSYTDHFDFRTMHAKMSTLKER